MEIRLAKTAGFCFGVNRAVELTYNLLNEGFSNRAPGRFSSMMTP